MANKLELAKTFSLERRRHTPGAAVQRFGDWRKGVPHVLIENRQWQAMGKPDTVTLIVEIKPSGLSADSGNCLGAKNAILG